MRAAPRRALLGALLAVAAASAAVRCGKDDSKKDPPPAAPPGQGVAPADWDGATDWAGSAFTIVDE